MKEVVRSTMNVLFYIKRTKTQRNGNVPVYARITINKIRAEFSTGRTIDPNQWDSKKNRAKGTTEKSKEINEALSGINNKIYNLLREMEYRGDYVSAKTLADEFQGKNERDKTIIQLFKDHNDRMKSTVGLDFAKNTPKKYNTSLKHLKDFLNTKGRGSDIPAKFIDLKFLNDFDHYLTLKAKLQPGSINTVMTAFKKIIRIALAHKIIFHNPFIGYKSKKVQIKRRYLEPAELKLIETSTLNDPKLERVRDFFLFACYTGLSHCDVTKITKDNLQFGISGGLIIQGNRQKTKTPFIIPVLEPAKCILEKYQSWPKIGDKLIPIISNQKTNQYLKDLGEAIGLEKELTFHMARHTFATTVTLSNGIPMETVKTMMAHSDIRTTQHYGKLLHEKVINDMSVLNSRLYESKVG